MTERGNTSKKWGKRAVSMQRYQCRAFPHGALEGETQEMELSGGQQLLNTPGHMCPYLSVQFDTFDGHVWRMRLICYSQSMLYPSAMLWPSYLLRNLHTCRRLRNLAACIVHMRVDGLHRNTLARWDRQITLNVGKEPSLHALLKSVILFSTLKFKVSPQC